jgi:SAM-dependent methyltransferase
VSASPPVPPTELISRVAGITDEAFFLGSGRQSVDELERTLAIVGRSLESFESVLDFGCGCGRMLLWMQELGRSRALHGTDIDSEAIEWCRGHIPWAVFSVNDPLPPLPYPEGAFDLVFNHSVFTHIDERRQDLWLSELQRITRPGGFVVLTVHGEAALPEQAWGIRDRLERDGIAFVEGGFPSDFALPSWYQNTWHAPWYVFEHWGRSFDVRGYVPRGSLGLQDQVLLERRDPDGGTASPPLAARPHLPSQEALDGRVAAALQTARGYRSGALRTRPRFGAVGAVTRRLMLRVIRPYTVHEDAFDDAVAKSISELTAVVDAQASLLKELQSRIDAGE